MPQVDYRVMEGVRHFLMLEKPDEFNAILAAFVEEAALVVSVTSVERGFRT